MLKKKLTTRKQALLVVSLLFCMIMFSSAVSAWGVYPARQHAQNSNELQSFEVTMVNSELKDGYFQVGFGGELAEYVIYDGGLVRFTQDKNQVTIPFKLQIDGDLEPGRNVLNVVLQEVSNEYTQGVGSTVALVAEVVVHIPVKGTAVSGQLHIEHDTLSGAEKFLIGVINKGDSAVPVWADIVVKGPANEVLAQWSTSKKIIGFASTGGIESYWSGEKEPGVYLAEVTLHYGEKTSLLRKEFTVGKDEILIESLSAVDFALGQIVPLDIVAYNQWNSLRQGVFGEIFVVTKTGNIIQSFKTSPEDIPAMSKVTLKGYWDTSKLMVGEYDLNVLMHFGEKTGQQQFPVEVSADKLKVLNRVSGQVIAQGDGSGNGDENNLYKILIVLIIVLIVINASWILIMRKGSKGGGKKNK